MLYEQLLSLNFNVLALFLGSPMRKHHQLGKSLVHTFSHMNNILHVVQPTIRLILCVYDSCVH